MKNNNVFYAISLVLLFGSCNKGLNLPNEFNQAQNSVKEGIWVTRNDSTNIITIQQYISGDKNGNFIMIRGDGSVFKKGQYRKGKKHGRWITYTTSNVISSEIRYNNGVVVQTKLYNLSW